jgi:hypothetical protein
MILWVLWTCAVSFGSFVAGCLYIRRRDQRLDFDRRCAELDAAINGTGPTLEDLREADALAPGSEPLAPPLPSARQIAEALDMRPSGAAFRLAQAQANCAAQLGWSNASGLANAYGQLSEQLATHRGATGLRGR